MSHPSVPDSLRERFDIHDAIEAGSTGPRFRATDKSTGRKGVLVLVDASALPSSSDRQRVRRELAKQATLSHPNLALPLVTGEAGKNLYYLREDVPGTTLRTRLTANPFQPSEALAIATQIAAGLDELHRAGLLFRDLKPERIVVQDGGNVVLLEAGLAAPIENEETVGLQGTAPYVSPEQAKGKLQSFRSDLYALGVVLHEMVAGEPPYSGDVEAILSAHRADAVPAAPSSLPEGAQELHQQLLAREPRKRPFSAQQVRQTLNPFLPAELQVSGGAAGPKPMHKATMLGMPAVGPARPPSMQPARPPSMEPPEPKPEPKVERKAGTTGHGNPDRTQQVALADIIEEQPLAKKPSTPPAAPGTISKPPPHPGSVPPEKPSVETTQPVDALDIIDEEEAAAEATPAAAPVAAPVTAAPVAPIVPASAPVEDPAATAGAPADTAGAYPAQPEAAAAFPEDPIPAPEGADDGGLDYDDLAETIAREAPSDLAGMSPAVAGAGAFPPADASSGGGAAFPPATSGAAASSPGVHVAPQQPASGAAAASGQGQYAEPVQAEPAGGSKNGLLFLAGGALIFLSVALFVGWQIISSQDETGPIAMAPSAAPAASPTPAVPPVAPTAPATPATPAAPAEPTAEEAEATAAAEAAAAEAAAAEAAAAEAAAAEAAAAEAAAAEAAAAEAAAEDEDEEPESRMAATRTTRRSTMRSAMAAEMAASGGSAFDQTREQAREAFQARNWAVAAQLYQRATAMNPRHAGSWSGLGAAQMQMRNYNGAVQSYQRAVTLNPRSSGFFTALGHAYRAQGNRNAAQQAYQRAIALSPQNRSAQQALQAL